MRHHLLLFLLLILARTSTSVAAADDELVVTVSRGDCCETLLFQGELRARDTVDIHAPEIRDYYLTVKDVLDDGTRVEQGDVVVRFDDTRYQQELESARQDLELRKADLEQTRFRFGDERIDLNLDVKRKSIAVEKARTEVVRDAVLISNVELQKAELSLKLAELELEQARKNSTEFAAKEAVGLRVQTLKVDEARRKVEEHETNIRNAVIKAPRDGVIYKPFVRLNNEKGRVEAGKVVNPGDKLLEIPSFEHFDGTVYVPSMDVAHLTVGDPVTLRLTVCPERQFTGKVIEKDAYAMTRNERLGRDDPDGHLKEFKVVIAVDETSPVFRPGLTFAAEVRTTLARDCLYLPRAALFAAADGRLQAYRREAAGCRPVDVTVGARGYTYAQVTAGLAAGDVVLLNRPPATSLR